ncbi:flagellar motor switch protein FliM [Paracoccus ravus]|uniref:flagellar motor switch protein FliM n=1 Tax=Paracoccus ravus TaxID=2447760 RepID=UPI00106E374F|nr:FliM/FliN family flagellar motor switch protein [Paracoccus ravus]
MTQIDNSEPFSPRAERDHNVEAEIIARASTGIEKLPMLEVIFARLTTTLASAFKSRLGTISEVSFAGMEYIPWGLALGRLDPFTLCCLTKIAPWQATTVLSFEPKVFFALFDSQISAGPGPQSIPARQPSSIERRIAKRFSQVVLDEISAEFGRLAEIGFTAENIETPQQAATVQNFQALCAVAHIRVKIGEAEGNMSFIMPKDSLHPIKSQLSRMFLAEPSESDGQWRDDLTRRVTSSYVEIQAVLHRMPMQIADILSWQPGTVLELGRGIGDEITITCSGRRIFHAVAGHHNNRIAVRLGEDCVATPNSQNQMEPLQKGWGEGR